jgi:hypothetical protein
VNCKNLVLVLFIRMNELLRVGGVGFSHGLRVISAETTNIGLR